VIHAIGQLDAVERLPRALLPLVRRDAGVHERELDVVQGRRAREQVERLKDEPDLLVSDARELVVRHGRDLRAVQPVFAGRRRIQAADDVHERRLAGSRRTHDGHVFIAPDGEIETTQRADDLSAHVVFAFDPARDDHPLGIRGGARLADDDLTFRRRAHGGIHRLLHVLAHDFATCFLVSVTFVSRTSVPSFNSRMAWYVPATILSPAFSPVSTSKCFSPAMPTLTGRNVTLLSVPTTKTPSTSFRPTSFVGFGRPRPTAVSPFASSSFSRTVSAMIGIDITLLRMSVMTFAVAEKSGRVSIGAFTS